MEHHFYFREWKTNDSYLDWGISQIFCWKWIKWACQVKQWMTLSVARDKILILKRKLELWKTWAHHRQLNSLIIETFLMRLWSESRSVVSDCLWPFVTYRVCGILQARILEWVAYPFSRGSFQSRDQTQVSHIASEFFASWAVIREAQEYWSGWPISSPAALPNPGMEPESPALQADSLPTDLSGKPSDEIGGDILMMGFWCWVIK